MQIQLKYDQTVYNIIQLINKKKYRRAIRIAEYLQAQGVSTHQLTTIKSYAIYLSHGAQSALITLSNHDSPLINMAKAQYLQSLSHFQESNTNYSKLTVNETNVLDLLITGNTMMLQKDQNVNCNFDQLAMNQHALFVHDRKQEECVNRINQITLAYQEVRQMKNRMEINQQMFKKKCEECRTMFESVYKEYRPKNQLKAALDQFTDFLTVIINKTEN